MECNAILVSSGGDSIISGWSDGRVRAFLPETGKLKFVINDAHTKLPNDKDNNGHSKKKKTDKKKTKKKKKKTKKRKYKTKEKKKKDKRKKKKNQNNMSNIGCAH